MDVSILKADFMRRTGEWPPDALTSPRPGYFNRFPAGRERLAQTSTFASGYFMPLPPLTSFHP